MNQPLSIIERARRYLAKVPHAVSGSGGHNATFHAALCLAVGFDLDRHAVETLMREYNMRCDPPWSEKELAHKINGAMTRKAASECGRLARAGGAPQRQNDRACAARSPRKRRPSRPRDSKEKEVRQVPVARRVDTVTPMCLIDQLVREFKRANGGREPGTLVFPLGWTRGARIMRGLGVVERDGIAAPMVKD